MDRLTFAYDGGPAILSTAELHAKTGELLAVVGPSGSGKSTLLRLIGGLLPRRGYRDRCNGRILVGGKRPGEHPAGTISLMFQEPALMPNRQVQANVGLALEMLQQPTHAISERVRESLAEVGLSKFQHLRPSQLSVGMKARVSLAMTIATRPSFLLLDEPFGALDVAWRFALYRTLVRIRTTNPPTTILVTHDLREAILLADVIVVLSSQGTTRAPVSVPYRKPTNYSADELAEYNARSLTLYSSLERCLLEASAVGSQFLDHD